MIVNEEVRKAWRQIYAISKEKCVTLYGKMCDFIWKYINF